MKTVTIIGAGWLGRPLAHYLKQNNYCVFASRTSDEGVHQLTEQGLNGFCCNFNAANLSLASQLREQKAQVVIGCFPPGFRRNQSGQYVQDWSMLVAAARKAEIKKIIMISSTGVYPETPAAMTEEKASLTITEQDHGFSEKARILLAAEQQVLDSGIDFTVLRCSGLFGPERHPSRFVEKMKQVSQRAPANMIHLDDVIGAITFAIDNLSCEVINVTTPETVSKATFYQAALQAAGSEAKMPPVTDTGGKQIISDKLCRAGYQFRYQHILDAL